jgi:hypothetical protein
MGFSLVHGTFSILDLVGERDFARRSVLQPRDCLPAPGRADYAFSRGDYDVPPKEYCAAETGHRAYAHCNGES